MWYFIKYFRIKKLAKSGLLVMIKWVRANECAWNLYTVENGHLEIFFIKSNAIGKREKMS